MQCAVNPETGRESTLVLKKAEHPKKVWVIGGGPGGMKAAEIAARRGHQVTLYEARDQLGGQFLLAAIPPHKQVLRELVTYLWKQIDKRGVKTVLNKPFDLKLLEKEKPDAAIVATGAKPSIPGIEGIQKAKVFNVWEALSKPGPLGPRVLVVGGGGVGAEVADFLSEKGKKVTLVEMREAIALDLVGHLQHYLNLRLKNKEVQVLTSTKAVRFEEDGLWVEDPQGTRKLSGFDSAVISMGSVSNVEIAEGLKKTIPQVLVIGDAATDNGHDFRINAGGAYSEIDAGETIFTITSAASMKENIKPLVDVTALRQVFRDSLEVSTYNWKRETLYQQRIVDELMADSLRVPDLVLAGSLALERLEGEQQAKTVINQEQFVTSNGKTAAGAPDLFLRGVGAMEWDPWLDDNGLADTIFVLDSKHVLLRPMEGEDNVVQKPERPYDQYVLLKAVTWTGVLFFDQLNCHGRYQIK